MTQLFRAWLPDKALSGFADRLANDVVAQWSRHWFTGRAMRKQTGFIRPDPSMRVVGEQRWAIGDGVAVGHLRPTEHALPAMMLDIAIEARSLQPADRPVLEMLIDDCLADLASRWRGVFRSAPAEILPISYERTPPDWNALWSCTIGPANREPLITLAVENDLLIARLKMGSPPPPPLPLHPVADALDRQSVEISALVGRCGLQLAELLALAPGDVLVLDQSFDAPVALAIDREPQAMPCSVEQDEEHLLLRFSPLISS